ncbi:hypothetical protein F3Y22_tig00116997pilonHSYRG00602 [Hibiscus syriacus]|uniref:Uncharacterized protein n=1 Tax=Hibiscus syriacus TaxID=106335 RepID=A0A6A2WRD5_HIBSY|nr:hypothetical protein F3Y22_tig00116997pilonHSYRG00602 [Hibiscus syriacus]
MNNGELGDEVCRAVSFSRNPSDFRMPHFGPNIVNSTHQRPRRRGGSKVVDQMDRLMAVRLNLDSFESLLPGEFPSLSRMRPPIEPSPLGWETAPSTIRQQQPDSGAFQCLDNSTPKIRGIGAISKGMKGRFNRGRAELTASRARDASFASFIASEQLTSIGEPEKTANSLRNRVLWCTTSLSCRKLEGSPLLKYPDVNLSGSVVQGHDTNGKNKSSIVFISCLLKWSSLKLVGISVLKHAGLNSSAKVDDKDEYYKQHHKIFQSEKSKGGKGAYGGANAPHHPNKKNAAPPLLNPPCLLLPVGLHVIFTLILSFPALFLNIF